MAERDNAVCAICGKGYHKCLSCKDKISNAPWKMHCCCSEHYKIYQILHGYTAGVYTGAEAKKRLKNVDLSDLNNLRENKQAKIKMLLGTADEPAIEIVAEPVVEPVIESESEIVDESAVEEVVETETTENIVESENIVSDFAARRRRK